MNNEEWHVYYIPEDDSIMLMSSHFYIIENDSVKLLVPVKGMDYLEEDESRIFIGVL